MHKNTNYSLRAWLSMFAAALFFFYWFIQLSLNNTLIDYYIARYQISSYGLFTSMYLIGNVLMFIPAGVILDRYNSKRVIVSALMVMLTGVAIMTFVSSQFIAYACMLLVGFGGAFTLLSCVRVATNWFDHGRIGFPISMAITIAFLGSYLGNAGGHALLVYSGSGQVVQITNIIMGLVIIALALVLIQKKPQRNQQNEQNEQNQQNNKAQQSVWSAFKNLRYVVNKKQNWLAALYVSLMNFPVMILEFSFGQAFLRHSFSITAQDAAMIAGIISIGYMIGGPLWNKLSDYYRSRKPFMLLGASLSLVVTLLLLNANLGYHALIVIFFFIGALTAAQNIGYPVIAESNPVEISASATSLASLIIMGGGALAQIGFGMLEQSLSFRGAYIVIPICITISLLLVFLIKEPKHAEIKAE
ncbi:MFS transporter [Cysteiniphilum sp. 6C5]|uniref:MFS transporter n=1 Tax=unclassified Cysteiniphilum TaxID=2610889 RepID=UPI003F87FCB9